MSHIVSFYPLIAALSSMFTAQVIKQLIFWIKGKVKVSSNTVFTAGGMPSTHSALVSGLTTAIALSEGTHSTVFALAVVFSCIVLYDASGIRRAVAKQAAVVNKITECSPKEKLSELVGHTPLEVAVGVIIGIGIASVLYHP